ncbi:hypothetical protein V5799_006376 [Amblyomma americanum]|uniref:Uncharacterized protein n=1 Tax=Amblyomma americanum TaxID=6943 RepID=A0AAQ4DWK2_AMBAM
MPEAKNEPVSGSLRTRARSFQAARENRMWDKIPGQSRSHLAPPSPTTSQLETNTRQGCRVVARASNSQHESPRRICILRGPLRRFRGLPAWWRWRCSPPRWRRCRPPRRRRRICCPPCRPCCGRCSSRRLRPARGSSLCRPPRLLLCARVRCRCSSCCRRPPRGSCRRRRSSCGELRRSGCGRCSSCRRRPPRSSCRLP